jgi:hypothetical protein
MSSNYSTEDVDRYETYLSSCEAALADGELATAQIYATLAVAASALVDSRLMTNVRQERQRVLRDQERAIRKAETSEITPPRVRPVLVPDEKAASGVRVVYPPAEGFSDRMKQQLGIEDP